MKKINRAILTLVVMLSATGMMFAQGDKSKHNSADKKEHFEKIEAAKKEYFTQELKLTDKESEKFWAVYKDFRKAEKANHKKQRELGRELRLGFDSIPDGEFKIKSEALLTHEAEDIEIKKRYLSKASEVIGYKRAAKSLYLEREFKRGLMDKVKDKRPGGKGPNPEKRQHKHSPVEK